MIKQLLLVGLGGGVGSIFRYLTFLLVNKYFQPGYFPWATFAANIIGCVIIGVIIGLSFRYAFIDVNMKLLLITGFCGGYTTFSTFSSENYQLLESHNYITLIAYIAASVLFGLLAVWIGLQLVKS